jgi:hypothetical protein
MNRKIYIYKAKTSVLIKNQLFCLLVTLKTQISVACGNLHTVLSFVDESRKQRVQQTCEVYMI